MRPLIGITPDQGLTTVRPGRPALERYELKQAYPEAVARGGGLPVVLPYSDEDAVLSQYLDTIQGLVVTGGAFDVPPEEYGAMPIPQLGPVNTTRTRFERRLMEGALKRRMPVLGICGGMQLLNVVHGGTLFQDIATECAGASAHEQPHDVREPAHGITIAGGSRVAEICGARSIDVNTSHHQAVRALGQGLVISAHAPDEVIEAIESADGSFTLGVQWHPELLSDPASRHLFEAFVSAVRG